ncbi:MAG: hypothetical protein GY865_07070, partial [candidate division Zixibacteria bacterium]|nr:hypothetical protein [candidate division Zixibacteria bacterium]
LPYDSETNKKNGELVKKLLKDNSFSPAVVKKIPSYFCSFDEYADYGEYQFAVYDVKLGLSGEVIGVETLFSNNDHYSVMFSNIILHSEYQPVKFENKAIASNTFVTVRFFQRISYPTMDWPPSYEKVFDHSFEYHRISSGPYLDSIVNPPFPRNLISGGVTQDRDILYNDTLRVSIMVDTLGNVRQPNYISRHLSLSGEIAKTVLKKLKYLPARDICGERVQYRGELTLIFNYNSKNIRIISDWLRR